LGNSRPPQASGGGKKSGLNGGGKREKVGFKASPFKGLRYNAYKRGGTKNKKIRGVPNQFTEHDSSRKKKQSMVGRGREGKIRKKI